MPKRDGPRRASDRPIVALVDETDNPTRMVYIQLRHRHRGQQTTACPGLTIRAFDFTPEEVHRIIVRALQREAEECQRLLRARRQLET